ncbi:uncharacterized protein LOC114916609 [Cajanus cajan]|uniref:uncharacterized protein LOC114916609 n=1 Tax=Cajanus cajan TaxID=3821 RepID=UPI0010FB1DDD|nr:uncharacterized protein LOC114916609 [Cajanus cajan]
MATRKEGKKTSNSSKPENDQVSHISSPPDSAPSMAPRTNPKPRSIGFDSAVTKKLKHNSPNMGNNKKTRKPSLDSSSPANVNSKETMQNKDETDGGSPTSVHEAHIQSTSLSAFPLVLRDESELLQSLWNTAVEESYAQLTSEEIFKAVSVNVELIKKRLKELSMKNTGKGETTNKNTIKEGIEISEAVSLLKLERNSLFSEIEMAGQKARRAATLMIQAQMMSSKASELLAQSKKILQSVDL